MIALPNPETQFSSLTSHRAIKIMPDRSGEESTWAIAQPAKKPAFAHPSRDRKLKLTTAVTPASN
jgi:hypothetical protein